MAQVPEKTLAWLYSVLHEYRDAQRAYADAARTLSSFPSLSPRTEVHIFENGSSSLLLTLSGTLPTTFRGTVYQFPIKLWLPRSYPQDPPFLYVTPSKDMQVRTGQHVGNDGRVYHPYLRDWSGIWDRASIVELLGYVQQVFSREPPVVAKRQLSDEGRAFASRQQDPMQTVASTSSFTGAPMPPPKQDLNNDNVQTIPGTSPPPRPPKPGEQTSRKHAARSNDADGPPLPPLPNERRLSSQPSRNGPALPPLPNQQSASSGTYGATRVPLQDGRTFSHPQTSARPMPAQQMRVQQQYNVPFNVGPVTPVPQTNRTSDLHNSQHVPHRPNETQFDPRRQSQVYNQQALQRSMVQQSIHAVQTTSKPKPVIDLLSDSLEIKLPTAAANLPAPPVPLNPEKEHLLQALSTTLVQQAQQRVNFNVAAVTPLQIQQTALQTAYSQLEAELVQLQALDAAIANNEAILRRSIQDCDLTIEKAKNMKQPHIDEVLVAETVVAQQLWIATVEEQACREAMYVLQKAVDRGRINGSDFVRQMRGLGRECFLKMALARKCARGLGLDLSR